MDKLFVVCASAIDEEGELDTTTILCTTHDLATAAKRRIMLADWEQSSRGKACFLVEERHGRKDLSFKTSPTEVYVDAPEDIELLCLIWHRAMWSLEEKYVAIDIREETICDTEQGIAAEIVVRSKKEDSDDE